MGLSISKHVRPMIKLLLPGFLLFCLLASPACRAEDMSDIAAVSPLDTMNFSIPEGGTLRTDSTDQKTFVIQGAEAGGVFLLNVDNEIFDDVLSYHETLVPIVMAEMRRSDAPEWEWYFSNSSLYGLLEISMGYKQQEYAAYVVRGNSACYIIWFDRNQIAKNNEIAIMESLRSSDITEELNKISSQAYADAIAESMAQEEYRFDLALPSGIRCEEQTESGALLYQKEALVGGYKVIHFEKGILPSVQENHDLILERMREYLKDQIDLTAFSGEIISESPITIQFRSSATEYTHHILSYGQVGTQYDIWFEEGQLEEDAIQFIIAHSQLTPINE